MTDQRKSSTGGPSPGTHDTQSPLGTGSNATSGGGAGVSPPTPASTASGTTTPGTQASQTSTATGTTTPERTGSERGPESVRAVQEGAEGARDTAREMRDEVVGAAKEKVSEAKQVARRKAEELTERGTRAASQRIAGFTRALRAAGDTLEDEGEGQSGTGLHGLADQLERAEGYFDRKDFQGLVGDTERLARRNPELFLAGAYAAGILIGRFLRSSRPEPGYGDAGDGRYGEKLGGRHALPSAQAYGGTASGGMAPGGRGAGTAVTP